MLPWPPDLSSSSSSPDSASQPLKRPNSQHQSIRFPQQESTCVCLLNLKKSLQTLALSGRLTEVKSPSILKTNDECGSWTKTRRKSLFGLFFRRAQRTFCDGFLLRRTSDDVKAGSDLSQSYKILLANLEGFFLPCKGKTEWQQL